MGKIKLVYYSIVNTWRVAISVIADCHVHLEKTEDPKGTCDKLVSAMDSFGVDKVCLFSPPPYPGGEIFYQDEDPDPELQLENANLASEVASFAPERIIPFAWISPVLNNSIKTLEKAVEDFGVKGIKMDPNHWYPYEKAFFPLYEKCEELQVPIIFHSGVNFGFVDTSRFCRPSYFEPLLRFPELNFALAHNGWPWVDECLAVAGHFKFLKDRSFRNRMQIYIDITPGTPPSWRKDALRKAVKYLDEDHILFGTDTFTGDLKHMSDILKSDKEIFEELGWSKRRQEKVLGDNLRNFLSES